jgi:hypothetical protein
MIYNTGNPARALHVLSQLVNGKKPNKRNIEFQLNCSILGAWRKAITRILAISFSHLSVIFSFNLLKLVLAA